MKRRALPKLKLVERKLGRERAYGQCTRANGLVEIDPRQSSKEYLDTLLHEMLHLYFPLAGEAWISKVAKKMATVAWKIGYRRIKE